MTKKLGTAMRWLCCVLAIGFPVLSGCGGGDGGPGDASADGTMDGAGGDASGGDGGPDEDGGPDDDGGPEDAGMEDAGDGGMGDAGPACTSDADCDDGVACTTDSCDTDTGECVNEGDDSMCGDGNSCTVDTCTDSGCSNTAEPDDTACTNASGTEGTCSGGVCVTGCTSDGECDDGVDCTTDTCDTDTGACSNVTDDAACDDGVDCTTDTCDATEGCQFTADDSACDDGVDCTTDSCDASSGCEFTPDDSACPDMPCTAESCSATGGCESTNLDDGTSCTDSGGNPGMCEGGTCVVDCVDDSDCDDGIDCTADSCNGDGECVHTTDDSACDDGVGCTTDTCTAGAGCTFTPDDSACTATDPCQVGFCDESSGCDTMNASDGSSCTSGGASGMCESGTCVTATQRVFRATSLELADPHAIIDRTSESFCSVCEDITNTGTSCFFGAVEIPALNPELQALIDEDGDGDGFRDLSFMLAFDPLVQDGTNDVDGVRLVEGQCDDADPNTCMPDPDAAFDVTTTYDTNAAGGGTCLGPISGTTDWSGVNSPSGGPDGCFAADEATVDLALDVGDSTVTLTLHRAQVGAQFSSDPATGMTNGLLRGFLTQADADDQVIEIEGQMVNLGEDVLPDDGMVCDTRDHCMGPDARDTADHDNDSSTDDACGWWMYVNFSATRISDPSGF